MSNQITSTSVMSDVLNAANGIAATTIIPPDGPINTTPGPNTYGTMVAGGDGGTEMSHSVGNIVSLSAPAHAGGPGHNQVNQVMADTNFENSLYRNVLIQTFTDFTDAFTSLEFRPWTNWLANAFIVEKADNFQFLRGSLVLSGTFKAPSLSSGLGVIYFYPSYQGGTPGIPIPAEYWTIVPHAFIDFSKSSDFEIELPWMVASDWGNLLDRRFAESWTVGFGVYVPIKSAIAGGCANAEMKIFARPGADFDLSGATYESGFVTDVILESTRNTRAARGIGSSAANTSKKAAGKKISVDSINDKVKEKTGGHKASEVVETASWGVGLIGGLVPQIAPATTVVSSGLSFGAKFLRAFGFTREQENQVPHDVFLRTSSNLVNVDGKDNSRMLALTQNNAVSIDPSLSGALSGIDEAAFAHITSKYQLLADLTFTVGNPTPTEYILPVTPLFGTWDTPTKFIPSPSCAIAARFTFWRSDMEYLFVPVISPIHRGMIQVCWQPIPRETDVTVDLTNLSANTIIDLEAGGMHNITVGYQNDNPMCYAAVYTPATEISSLDYAQLNGYLRIKDYIPITGTDCGEIVHVLVFARPGKNFQIGSPTDVVVMDDGIPSYLGVDFVTDVVLQSGSDTLGTEGQTINNIILIPSSGNYPLKDILMGEDILSVRTLMQKPSLWLEREGIMLTEEAQPYYFEHFNGPADDCRNYVKYFGEWFLGMAGSMRIKLILSDDQSSSPSDLQIVPMISAPYAESGSFPISEVSPVVVYNDSWTVESIIPYYWKEKFIPAYKASSTEDDSRQANTMSWQPEIVINAVTGDVDRDYDPWACNMMRYKFAGTDLRLNFFRAQSAWDFNDFAGPESNIWSTPFIANAPFFSSFARSKNSKDPQLLEEQKLQRHKLARARLGPNHKFKEDSRRNYGKNKFSCNQSHTSKIITVD